jgi:hypothetical protein
MILPTFEFLIDDSPESGVKAISMVTSPAMKSGFIAFNTIPATPKFIFISKDEKEYKGIVAGLAMIPNKLIYRIAEDGTEYNGFFSSETIEKIRDKYHREQLTQVVNLEHSDTFVKAYLVESYILDTEEMVAAVKKKGIREACLGAWFTAYKVEDREVFQQVLDGVFTGFSIEANLELELKLSEVSINNNNKNVKKMKKNLTEKIREQFNKMLNNILFEEALCPEQNFVLVWGVEGEAVTKTYTNVDGMEVTEPVGQGEFVIEDGRTVIVDENSALVEVREAVVEEVPVEEVPAPVEEEVPAPVVSGETEMDVVVDPVLPVVSDFEKPLGSFLDLTKDGKYSIECIIEAGLIKSATVKSVAELMSAQDAVVTALNAEIAELKVKLSAPIATPILGNDKVVEITAYETNYERVAARLGLPIL